MIHSKLLIHHRCIHSAYVVKQVEPDTLLSSYYIYTYY